MGRSTIGPSAPPFSFPKSWVRRSPGFIDLTGDNFFRAVRRWGYASNHTTLPRALPFTQTKPYPRTYTRTLVGTPVPRFPYMGSPFRRHSHQRIRQQPSLDRTSLFRNLMRDPYQSLPLQGLELLTRVSPHIFNFFGRQRPLRLQAFCNDRMIRASWPYGTARADLMSISGKPLTIFAAFNARGVPFHVRGLTDDVYLPAGVDASCLRRITIGVSKYADFRASILENAVEIAKEAKTQTFYGIDLFVVQAADESDKEYLDRCYQIQDILDG